MSDYAARAAYAAYGAATGGLTHDGRPMPAWEQLGGTIQGAWAAAAGAVATNSVKFMDLVLDLDRCEHGRHRPDPCFDCEGQSRGNPNARPGQVLGYGRRGDRIVVPPSVDRNDPSAWRRPA